MFENLYRSFITLCSFTRTEFFISLNTSSSTLTPENWNVHPLPALLRATNFTFLLYLKINFNIRCDNLSAKGSTSSRCGILRFLNVFEKKIFTISAFITFYKSNFFWRLCLIRSKVIIMKKSLMENFIFCGVKWTKATEKLILKNVYFSSALLT